jgi:predicted transcriptional regulator
MQIPTGEDIRAAQENNGLTQAELADRAGVSQLLIARIESNNVDPTIDTLYSVIAALNDSFADLEQEEVKISMPSVLEDARKRTGYTQGELADAAGVSQPLISRVERQDVNPRSSTLRSLFDELESATDSPDTGSSTLSTSGSSLREKIEWEFKSIQVHRENPRQTRTIEATDNAVLNVNRTLPRTPTRATVRIVVRSCETVAA